MKVCKQCNESKSPDMFYKCPGNKDGREGKCKECMNENSMAVQRANPERTREYSRRSMKNRDPEKKKKHDSSSKEWRRADPRRRAAHEAVAKAIISGSLVKQACSICNSEQAVAHHEDYDKPLDVVWLCSVHHKQRHMQIRRDKNAVA